MVGGDRVYFYPAGTEVPAVSAAENTEGYYLLPTSTLTTMMAD